LKKPTLFSSLFVALLVVGTGAVQAAQISGTIDSTLTITEDSDLTGDVTCTGNGPCIAIGAPGITLRLNAYTMTGLADAQTGCASSAGTNGPGVLVSSQIGATIQGPGVIRQFQSHGVQLLLSTGVTVMDVTTATNCGSGIWVGGGADNQLVRNISIRNGAASAACGGI
jgi:hypothetical protein